MSTETLIIQVEGKVVSSNMEAFTEKMREFLASINKELSSDLEFGQAETDAKQLKTIEENIKAAKEKALADAEQLHALFSALDTASEECRQARLNLENQIKKRKEEIKEEIVKAALADLDCQPAYRAQYHAEIVTAMKGKKTVDSLKASAAAVVAARNAQFGENKEMLQAHKNAHGIHLVMDEAQLITHSPEALRMTLERRVEKYEAEQREKKLQAEANEAKAKADALAKMQADEDERRDRDEKVEIMAEIESKRDLIANELMGVNSSTERYTNADADELENAKVAEKVELQAIVFTLEQLAREQIIPLLESAKSKRVKEIVAIYRAEMRSAHAKLKGGLL